MSLKLSFLFLWMNLIYHPMELYHTIESHEKIAFDAIVKIYLKMLYIADFQLGRRMAGSVRSPWIWSQNIRCTPIHPHSSTNYFWLFPLLLDRVLKSHKKTLFVYKLLNLPSKMPKMWIFSKIQLLIFP